MLTRVPSLALQSATSTLLIAPLALSVWCFRSFPAAGGQVRVALRLPEASEGLYGFVRLGLVQLKCGRVSQYTPGLVRALLPGVQGPRRPPER